MVRTLGIDKERNSKRHKTNGSPDSNELINENYQLLQKISDLENKMKLIKHEYGIKVIDDGKSYYLQANKVDSALMLWMYIVTRFIMMPKEGMDCCQITMGCNK